MRSRWEKTDLLCALVFAVGALAACLLFMYALSCPLSRRVQGDSLEYLKIADSFTSLPQALSYTGDRTYGYPMFLCLVGWIASPSDLATWLNGISIVQLGLHIVACILFYAAVLRPLFEKAALPRIAAASLASVIMSYPTLVTYTSLPLTDTFCVDLIMIAACISFATLNQTVMKACLGSGLCGLVLGYTIMVRPSFWPAISAFCIVSMIHAALRLGKQWSAILKATSLVAGIATIIAPALWNGRNVYGTPALQKPEFVKACSVSCLQSGLYSVRVFWSFTRHSKESLPGIRDPLLVENYEANKTDVQSPATLLKHLFSKPQVVPFYIGKKTIALFDEPHIQPYLAEETPPWFSLLQRVFATGSFCGLIALLVSLVTQIFSKRPQSWIGFPWAVFVVFLLMTHGVVQIEGRYGFSAIPLCLASLFLGYSQARQLGTRFTCYWALTILIAAGIFLYQVTAWDHVAPV